MNGLVYEHSEIVQFHMSDEAREQKVDQFISWLYDDIGDLIGEFFASQQKSFFDNKVSHTFHLPNGETVPVGMKIGKALGRYFREYYSDEDIERVRIEASRIIQEDCVSGKLCVSIHPLDFLSSSENNHSWRSCHALDGEYRGGNLSYMLDDCTCMVYLKSDKEDVKLPRFPKDVPWNDKKWRCLFHFDWKRGCVWAGRQYPFTADSALDTVVDILFKPLKFFEETYTPMVYHGDKFFTEIEPVQKWMMRVVKEEFTVDEMEAYLIQPYFFYGGSIVPMSELIEDGRDSLHYNDLLKSHYYTPYCYVYRHNVAVWRSKIHPPMKVGRKVPCVHCAEKNVYPNETMLCKDCLLDYTTVENEEVGYCAHCGRRIIFEMEYGYHGSYYCTDCHADLFYTCESCGDVRPLNRMYEEDDKWYCSYCFDNLHAKEEGNHPEVDGNPFLWSPWG